jgi:hypothetical protein
MRHKRVLLAVVGLILTSHSRASAGSVTLTFSGGPSFLVGSCYRCDPDFVVPPQLQNTLPPGEFPDLGPFSGTLTLDTQPTDSDPNPLRGVYTGAISGFTLDVAGLVLSYDANEPGAASQFLVIPSGNPLIAGQIILQAKARGVLTGSPADQYTVSFLLQSVGGFYLPNDSVPYLPALPTQWSFALDVAKDDFPFGSTATSNIVDAGGPIPGRLELAAPEPFAATLSLLSFVALALARWPRSSPGGRPEGQRDRVVVRELAARQHGRLG